MAFKIKPKNTLVPGDSINNTAAIYFDFNLPVITNKAYTIVSMAAPVPITLEYFALNKKDKSNLLKWKVATTEYTNTFNIERSADGIHFNAIGNLTATAQRCQLPFSFIDENPFTGKNYYRLKITDVNGLFFYSKILMAEITKSGLEITAVINESEHTILYLNSSRQQTVQIKLIGIDGKSILSVDKSIASGNNRIDLRTRQLSKGIYALVIYTNEGEIITYKFVR